MITITPSFTKLVPMRTEAWVRLVPDNYVRTQPEFAEFVIMFDDAPEEGDVIEINTASQVFTFTCAAAYDGSGNVYLPAAGPNTGAISLREAMATNELLTRLYVIGGTGPSVVLTARSAGAAHSLIFGISTPPDRVLFDTYEEGQDLELEPSYSACLRALIEPSEGAGFDVLPTERHDPGPQMAVETRVDGLLLDFLKPDWPAVGQTGAAILNERSLRPFYLHAWERYGDPPVDEEVTSLGSPTAPYLAWLAGYTRPEWGSYTAFTDRLLGNSGAPHPFLTYRGRKDRHYVTTDEQHYLGWFHWAMNWNGTPLSLQARLTHVAADGSDPVTTSWSNRYNVSTSTTCPRGRSATFNVGYTQLGLNSVLPSGRVPVLYQVRIWCVTGAKSETLSFYLTDPDTNELHLQFVNSLGIVENLRSTGQWRLSQEQSYQPTQRAARRADLATSDAGRYGSNPMGGQPVLDVFTGWRPQAEHEAILDVLGSVETKLLDVANSRRLKLHLVKGSQQDKSKRGQEDEWLYGMQVQFQLDDPTAITTLPMSTADMVHSEQDSEEEPDPEDV